MWGEREGRGTEGGGGEWDDEDESGGVRWRMKLEINKKGDEDSTRGVCVAKGGA